MAFGARDSLVIDKNFVECFSSSTLANELFYYKNDIVLSQILQLYVYSRFACQFFVDNYDKLIALRSIHLVVHKIRKEYVETRFVEVPQSDGICFIDVLKLLFKIRNIKVIHLYAYDHIMDDYVMNFIEKSDFKKIVLHYYDFNDQYESEYIHLNSLHNVYCMFHTTKKLAELMKNNLLISKLAEIYRDPLEITGVDLIEALPLLEYAPYSVKCLRVSVTPVTSNLNLSYICPLSLDLSFFTDVVNISMPWSLTSLTINSHNSVIAQLNGITDIEKMNLIYITLENVRLKSLTNLNVKTSLKHVTYKQCENLSFLNDGEMVIDEITVTDSQNCFITSNTCSFSLSNFEIISNNINSIKKDTIQPLFYTNNNVNINLLEVKANICISKDTLTIQCGDTVYLSDFYYTTDNCKNDNINSVMKEKTVFDLSEFSFSNINITRFNQPCIFHIKRAYNLTMFYCNNIDIICKEKCDLNDFHVKECYNCSLVNFRSSFSYYNRYNGIPNDIIELENMIKCGIEVIKGALTTSHKISDDVSNGNFFIVNLIQLLPKLPEGIILIDNYTFHNFSYTLTSIELPNSLTEIRKLAFRNCIFLKSMNFKNVKIIKEKVFTGCSSLSSITFSDHVCEIGENCFSNCSSLKNITIPSKIVKLGKNAFGKLGIVVFFSISNQLNQTENLQEYIVLPTSIQTLEIPTTLIKNVD
ncbi:hypothetical protein QTN25_000838 [Entamoeba marina]